MPGSSSGAPSTSARGKPALRRVGRALLVGVALSVAVTAVSRIGLLAGWETRAVDTFLFFRDRVPASEIVLVEIDEEAFREVGERQPLSRRYLGELAEFLAGSGARVVGFDVLMKSPGVPEEDAVLLRVARRLEGRLIFTALALPRPGTDPPRYELSPPFSPALRALFGFANAPLGGDGVIRKMAPVLPGDRGRFLPSFALAVLAAHAGQSPESLARALGGGEAATLALPRREGGARREGGTLREEPVTLPALAGDYWRIDFAGPARSLTSFPATALVAMARSGGRPAPDNPFNGKIVLVGATFREGRDFYPTPVGVMAGVEIQANMVHTLLGRRAVPPPHWAWNVVVLASACVAVALLSLWLRPLAVGLLTLALVVALAAASYEAYVRGGYWLDFVAPLCGMTAYLQGSKLLARRRLRAAFGQYVSVEVMDRVLREGSDLGGEVRTVSVLMSDVRGFTTLSERLPPAAITATINEYFPAMVDAILAHRGIISDFIGDGILAMFGAPLDDPDHAWHAVETALAMQAALARLNARWQTEGRPTLAMGVAVNTGEVFAGNVGSARKKKYAVIGDPVNTVSRMEGLNRELGTAILISGATLAAVKDRVVVHDRGAFTMKGKTQPVELFELVGIREEGDSR